MHFLTPYMRDSEEASPRSHPHAGSGPDSDSGLPSTDLVGTRTVHRSSFHILKTSEAQLHSQLVFFPPSLELFPIYLNYPLTLDLLQFGFILNYPFLVIKEMRSASLLAAFDFWT